MSIFRKVLVVTSMLVLVVGCGTVKSKDSSKADEASQVKTFKSLPAGVVTRVPVVDGKEVTDQAETKLVDQDSANDGASTEAMFQAGKTPENLVAQDELDKDSSTQSWYYSCGYSYYSYCNNYSYGYGYNSYYRYYSPYSYYNGYNWPYSYNNYYNYGGYNYYHYRRSCYSYSWCSSYGYGY